MIGSSLFLCAEKPRHPLLSVVLSLGLLGNTIHSVGLVLAAAVPHAAIGSFFFVCLLFPCSGDPKGCAAAMMLCPLTMVPFMLMSGFFLNVNALPMGMVPSLFRARSVLTALLAL